MGDGLRPFPPLAPVQRGPHNQDRLENCEANREARERAGLPPLSPVQSPPRFDDLPSLSDIDSEDKEEEEEQE